MLVMGARGATGYVMAQGRPAAGGLPVAGAALWFDASQITGLADGDSVTTWSDMSGNTRHATQSGAGTLKPTYKTNIIGGKPILRFVAASSQRLDIDGTMAIGASTTFVVFRTAATVPNFQSAINFYQSGSVRWSFGANAIESNRNGWAGTNASTALTQPSGAFSTDSAYVQTWKKTSTQWTIYRNGTAGTAINDSSSATAAASGVGYERGFNSYYFNGDIAEIIVYSSALSDANRQAVEAYLSAKYGIAL